MSKFEILEKFFDDKECAYEIGYRLDELNKGDSLDKVFEIKNHFYEEVEEKILELLKSQDFSDFIYKESFVISDIDIDSRENSIQTFFVFENENEKFAISNHYSSWDSKQPIPGNIFKLETKQILVPKTTQSLNKFFYSTEK